MQKSTFSARAAASYLGFATSNPILDAIRSGELPAERRPGVTRNGRNTANYIIRSEHLDNLAAQRGIVPVGASAVPERAEPPLGPLTAEARQVEQANQEDDSAAPEPLDIEPARVLADPADRPRGGERQERAPQQARDSVQAWREGVRAPAAADRLALLCELVRAAQWDTARVVIAVWDGRPLAAEAKAAPRPRSARK